MKDFLKYLKDALTKEISLKHLYLILLSLALMASCAHDPKKKAASKKETYSPVISFQEDKSTYSAIVQLPKNFKNHVPLVVVVHEWWGRVPYVHNVADRLTAAGYATLVVDLFGDGKKVSTPTEAQALATPFYQNPQLGIDRLSKYIEIAKNDPHIDASRIYVIGYCFGGTQALNLARSGADVAGVVSFHGGLASSLPQGPIKAKVLALNGLADPMVPPKERTAFEDEMKTVKADYKVVNYKSATHAFTNPSATEIGKKFNIPIAYNRRAAEASWNEPMKFLKK